MSGPILPITLLYVGAVLFINSIFILTDQLDAKEVAVMNLFTGGIAFLNSLYVGYIQGATFALAQGLLFAFTYLWVFINFWLERKNNRALGWYCLFVAIVAAPVGIFVIPDLPILGIIWETWAYLWFIFYLFMGLEWNIPKITGWSSLIVGTITGAYGFWIFQFVGHLA